MNIFVLDLNAATAARYHCDKHVRKMVIESAQMLTCAYYFGSGIKTNKELDARRADIDAIFKGFPRVDADGRPNPYRISHPNHPCTIWTSASANNFSWHRLLAIALAAEYRLRWGKEHAVEPILKWMLNNDPSGITGFELTPFPQAMPNCFRGPDPVQAYRRLYHWKASVFSVAWKAPRAIPEWFSFDRVQAAKSTYEQHLGNTP